MPLYYLLAVNAFSFALMGVDKAKARRGKRRVPEKVLFLWAILGGGVGAVAGMLLFRHKTRHLSFVIGLPVILALQLAAAVFLLLR